MAAHKFWKLFFPGWSRNNNYLSLSEVELRETLGVTPPSIRGSVSLTSRTSNVLGPAALPLIVNGSADDSFVGVTLPFNVNFFTGPHNKIYICSNGYITFGTGTSVYGGLSAVTPGYPGIFINAADRSYQRVYAGAENDGATYRIRYEGSTGTSGTVGSPTVVWEITFTAGDPNTILLDIGANSATGGFSAVKSQDEVKASLPSTVNVGYTIGYVQPELVSLTASSNSGYVAFPNLVDGNKSSGWETPYRPGADEWLKFELLNPKDLVSIALTNGLFSGEVFNSFYVMHSDDGLSYTYNSFFTGIAWSGVQTKEFVLGNILNVNYKLLPKKASISKTINDNLMLTPRYFGINRYMPDLKLPLSNRKYLGGNYKITGVTKELGIPVSRLVRLYDAQSGNLVMEKSSDLLGNFEFSGIQPLKYSVVGVDRTGVENSVIFANVEPVLM